MSDSTSAAPVTTATPAVAAGGVPETAPIAPTDAGNRATPATPPVAPKYKFSDLKVDGKTIEKEYTHDELKALLQKHSAADKRLSELSNKEKGIAAALARLKEDPFAALADPALGGINLEEIAIQRLAEKFQREELEKNDPAAAERMKLEQELKSERAQKSEYQKQIQAAADQKQYEHIHNETMSTYQTALSKLGVPPTDDIVNIMLEADLIAIDHKMDLNADQLALAAKETLEAREQSAVTKHRGRWGSMEGEDLLKDLGDDTVKKVQMALLSRARALVGKAPAPVEQRAPEGVEPPKRVVERDADVRKRLGVAW